MRSTNILFLKQTTLFSLLFLFCFQTTTLTAQQNPPNILLVIADDLGVDVSNGYHQSALMPSTPTLDALRTTGITFDNVFAAPKCTPSRANMMSGKYGVKTGVTGTPGNLDLAHTSIFTELENQTNNQYADAVIGKWHISSPNDPLHPANHNADYYMGLLSSSVDDYFAWKKTENGVTTIDSSYVTTSFTNAAIDWVGAQNQPWFLWLAHVAPHTPLHVPPSHMYSIGGTNTNLRKYLAMIESMDYEFDRLLNSMPDSVRDNTLIIYIGDNGTPNNLLRDYPDGHGKGSVYQGGIRVPMIIAGAGVSRKGEREAALIHISDIYATILEVAGAELPGGLYNSLSFSHLLTNDPGPQRDYNYSEINSDGVNAYAIRGSQYKLIQNVGGSQEFYDLLTDSLELNNLLLTTLTADQILIKEDLETEALQIRSDWSCRDYIQNGEEEGIDCGGSFCTPCITNTADQTIGDDEINIYPNPGSNYVQINAKSQLIQKIKIFNAFGEQVFYKENINSQSERVDIDNISAPILFIEVTLDNQMKTLKLIKTE